MTLPLSLEQTAAELGRSADWLQRNWPDLVKTQGFPLPLHDTKPYCWAPEHIEAWKDRRLTEALARRVNEIRGRQPSFASLKEQQETALEDERAEIRQELGMM